jgi:hypothetical protein
MMVLTGEESELRMRQVPNESAFIVETELIPPLGAGEDQGDRVRRNQKSNAILNCWL